MNVLFGTGHLAIGLQYHLEKAAKKTNVNKNSSYVRREEDRIQEFRHLTKMEMTQEL